MPTWNIRCSCGGRSSAFVTLRTRRQNDGLVPCEACGELNETAPTACNFNGFGKEVTPTGQELTTKELDKMAKEQGVSINTPGSAERKALKEWAREQADKSAQKQGFTDVEHKRATWKDKKAKVLEQRREAQIEKYHKRLGTHKGKQSPTEAFGPAD